MRDSDNANALVDGSVFVAPTGSTFPTNPTSDPDAAFLDTGWLSDAGISETPSTDTTPKRGINGSIVKTVKAADDYSTTFECYERNAVTAGLLRPGSVPATIGGITTTPVKSYLGSDERAFIVDKDFGVFQERINIPRGQAFLTGASTDKPGDLRILQFRIDAYPGSDGTNRIVITNNPAEAVA